MVGIVWRLDYIG